MDNLIGASLAGNAEQREDFFNEVVNASDRLNRLIGNLLDMSRMTAGKFALDREPLEPGALARQALLHLEPLTEMQGLRVVSRIADGLPEPCSKYGRTVLEVRGIGLAGRDGGSGDGGASDALARVGAVGERLARRSRPRHDAGQGGVSQCPDRAHSVQSEHAQGAARADFDRAGMDHEVLHSRFVTAEFANPISCRAGTYRVLHLLAESYCR